MQGYGYSVWAVPKNYKKIRSVYGMKHIPHITLSTNHIEPPEISDFPKEVVVSFEDKNMYRIPSMYEYEPLNLSAAGFYCKVNGYNNPLLHMTLFYDYHGNYLDFCTR